MFDIQIDSMHFEGGPPFLGPLPPNEVCVPVEDELGVVDEGVGQPPPHSDSVSTLSSWCHCEI